MKLKSRTGTGTNTNHVLSSEVVDERAGYWGAIGSK